MFTSGKPSAAIVKEKGNGTTQRHGCLGVRLVDQVIVANPKPVADFKAGNPAPLNFLKGQVMKLSKGQANPVVTSEILHAQADDAVEAASRTRRTCRGETRSLV